MAAVAPVQILSSEYAMSFSFLFFMCFSIIGWASKSAKLVESTRFFYPTMYASEAENEDAKLFNCVQRGHQNSLELMPMFFLLMVLGGMRHPFLCSSFGILLVVLRYFYFTDYATGIPENRGRFGRYSFLALLGLKICTIPFSVALLRR